VRRDRPAADDEISTPELSNSANRSVKSGDRSIVALKVPRVAQKLDGGLELLAEAPLAPEVEVCFFERGERRDAAEDKSPAADFATMFCVTIGRAFAHDASIIESARVGNAEHTAGIRNVP
jgi:hypothetical protein